MLQSAPKNERHKRMKIERKNPIPPQKGIVKKPYPHPSRYGSHASMVTHYPGFNFGSLAGWVVCKDEYGTYKTERKNLDTGVADPARHNRLDACRT